MPNGTDAANPTPSNNMEYIGSMPILWPLMMKKYDTPYTPMDMKIFVNSSGAINLFLSLKVLTLSMKPGRWVLFSSFLICFLCSGNRDRVLEHSDLRSIAVHFVNPKIQSANFPVIIGDCGLKS